MSDPDPTGPRPSSPTEPLPAPATPAGPPPPASGRRWLTWQVGLVAVAALIIGLGLGALTAGSDEDETAAVAPTTSEPSPTTAPPTSGTQPPPTTDGDRPGGGSRDEERGDEERGDEERGGQTVVGNSSSIFTGSYSSNRDKTTDEFTVEDDWTIRWDVDEGIVTISVLDGSGEVVDTVEAEGEGERDFPEGGTYRLEITTDGSRYTVVVTDGP